MALPTKETPNMADDPQLREMTSDPKFRKVLVTDGKTAVGQALVEALSRPAPSVIWVGVAEPWKPFPGEDEAAQDRARRARAARPHRPQLGRRARRRDRRQGRHPGQHRRAVPHRRHRRAQGHRRSRAPRWRSTTSACCGSPRRSARRCARAAPTASTRAAAWVNLLSIYALANLPPHGTFSARRRPPIARAVPARRDAAGRRQGGQRLPRPDRRRMEPGPAAAQGRAGRAGERDRARAAAGRRGRLPRRRRAGIGARLADNPKALERELGS